MRTIEYKTERMLEVETKLGGSIEEALRVMYVDKDMHINDICNALGTSYNTTLRWLELAGIWSRRIKVDN